MPEPAALRCRREPQQLPLRLLDVVCRGRHHGLAFALSQRGADIGYVEIAAELPIRMTASYRDVDAASVTLRRASARRKRFAVLHHLQQMVDRQSLQLLSSTPSMAGGDVAKTMWPRLNTDVEGRR